jgi:predicted enzyme related to lactoylglutathione lyase
MKNIAQLAIISVLVENQDEALHFYTEKLGLEKRADVTYGPGLRWLTVAPRGQRKPEIALATPDPILLGTRPQQAQVARGGERLERFGQWITWVFDTDDCCKMYNTLLSRGVKFVSPPTKHIYGMEAVFEDPYGNLFSLLEPSPEAYFHSISTAA